jgi:hypothetical protein
MSNAQTGHHDHTHNMCQPETIANVASRQAELQNSPLRRIFDRNENIIQRLLPSITEWAVVSAHQFTSLGVWTWVLISNLWFDIGCCFANEGVRITEMQTVDIECISHQSFQDPSHGRTVTRGLHRGETHGHSNTVTKIHNRVHTRVSQWTPDPPWVG